MKKSFPVGPGEPPRLEFSCKSGWHECTYRLDGVIVAGPAESAAFRKGLTFRLPDGSLIASRRGGLLNAELLVLRNGAPLPGSSSHPAKRIGDGVLALAVAAVLNVFLGATFVLARGNFTAAAVAVAVGFGFVVIRALFRSTFNERFPIAGGVLLFLDGFVGLFYDPLPFAFLLIRLAVALVLYRAFEGARDHSELMAMRRQQPAFLRS